mgnify:CR=1 FL=1
MTTIHIAASREYDVVIEPGLLTRLGTMAAELGLGRRAAVISDDAVFALYGAAAEKALTDAGFQVDHFLFPHGEQQKNLSTYGQVLNFLCDRRFTRSDFLVVLGGKTIGYFAWKMENTALHLLHLYLKPEYRGKAIGRDIVASCERLARGEGRGRVWCGVNAKALPVQQFFKARGYRSLGPAESEGGIERNELIFERML